MGKDDVTDDEILVAGGKSVVGGFWRVPTIPMYGFFLNDIIPYMMIGTASADYPCCFNETFMAMDQQGLWGPNDIPLEGNRIACAVAAVCKDQSEGKTYRISVCLMRLSERNIVITLTTLCERDIALRLYVTRTWADEHAMHRIR